MAQVFNQDVYTATAKQSELYSDFFTNLDVHPETGDLVRRVNEDAVKVSVMNIILTNKYERPFNPNFGSNIRNYLFEPITPITTQNLITAISSAIKNYEPRANLINVNVTPYIDEQAYAVSVVFSILNISNSVTLNTILSRVR